MHAEIRVGGSLAFVIHPEEFRVLRKQCARQEIVHRVKLVFDLQTEARTGLEKFAPGRRLNEPGHPLSRSAMVQGNGRKSGARGPGRPLRARHILRDEHNAASAECFCRRGRPSRDPPIGKPGGDVKVRFPGFWFDPTQPVVLGVAERALAKLRPKEADSQDRSRGNRTPHEVAKRLQGYGGFHRIAAGANRAGSPQPRTIPPAVEFSVMACGVVVDPAERVDLHAEITVEVWIPGEENLDPILQVHAGLVEEVCCDDDIAVAHLECKIKSLRIGQSAEAGSRGLVFRPGINEPGFNYGPVPGGFEQLPVHLNRERLQRADNRRGRVGSGSARA